VEVEKLLTLRMKSLEEVKASAVREEQLDYEL
jgi:hypothetical protein